MKTDNLFNPKRFGLMCRKAVVEPWKMHQLRFILMYAVLGVILFIYCFKNYRYYTTDNLPDPQHFSSFYNGLFFTGLFFFGLLAASAVMGNMKSKTDRISLLTLPASMLEKYLSAWLVYTVGFVAIYLLAFWLADWSSVLLCRLRYSHIAASIQPSTPLSIIGRFMEINNSITCWGFVGSYLFAQSLFVLGSCIWPKAAFLKTTAALVAVGIVYAIIGGTVLQLSKPDIYHYAPLFDSPDARLLGQRLFVSFLFVMAMVNWVLGYFRFKESEVINRW